MAIPIIIQQYPGEQGGVAPTPPSPPRNLRSTGVTQQHAVQAEMSWAWDAPTSFGGPGERLSRYETQYKEVSATAWSGIHNNGTSRTRTIVVPEDASKQYQLRVRTANNQNRRSGWVVSDPVIATINQPVTGQRAMQWMSRAMQWQGREQVWGV